MIINHLSSVGVHTNDVPMGTKSAGNDAIKVITRTRMTGNRPLSPIGFGRLFTGARDEENTIGGFTVELPTAAVGPDAAVGVAFGIIMARY